MVLIVGSILIIAILYALAYNEQNKKKEKALKAYDEMQRKHTEIKKRNDLRQKRWNELMKLREQAKFLEKENENEKAINLYLEEIALGEKHENLRYANYAHSIKRVIILYGKTKQFQKLKEFLDLNIKKYPNSSEIEDWNKRLDKVNSKIKK